MRGARPLSQEEHLFLKESFNNTRNKCLYLLGKNTGFRLSELLSLYVHQVYQKDYLKVERKNMKGKTQSREIPLNKEAKDAIQEYLSKLGTIDTNSPLFKNNKTNKPLTRFGAQKALSKVFKAHLQGSVSSHSMRKSWAMKVYEKSGRDLIMTSKALGHADIGTTIKYLPVNQDILNKIMNED